MKDKDLIRDSLRRLAENIIPDYLAKAEDIALSFGLPIDDLNREALAHLTQKSMQEMRTTPYSTTYHYSDIGP